MKKFLLKLISLMLLISMLLPLAAACADEPPPSENPNENGDGEQNPPEEQGEKFVTVKQTGTDTFTLLDTANTNNTLFGGQPYAPYIDNSKGKNAIKWKAVKERLTVLLPEALDVAPYYYVEFELYSSAPITVDVGFYFGGDISTSYKNITITLSGGKWQKVKIRSEEYSVVNPYPAVYGVMLALNDVTVLENQSEPVYIYLSDVTLTKPVYELNVPNGIDITNAEYYDTIINNAAIYMVGDGVAVDNAAYTTKVAAFQSNALDAWDLFKETYKENETPETNDVFNIPMSGYDEASHKVEPKCGVNIAKYYAKLEAMAKGYACVGTSTYKNADLLADIKKGLEYGYKYYYGEEILQTGKTYGNWYDWDISTPSYIINVLTLIRDTLSDAEISKYLAPFDKLVSIPQGAAANRMTSGRLVILSGALQKNALKIAVANELLAEVFVYVDEIPIDAPIEISDGGFYSDGGFVQHGGVAYTGVYGLAFINALAQTFFVASGTPFEISCEGVEHQYEWIFNAYRTILYDDSMMAFTFGRQIIQRNMERQYMGNLLSLTSTMRYYAPDDLKDDFDSFNKLIINEIKPYWSNWIDQIPFPFIKYCLELDANDSIEVTESLLQTIVFPSMDAVVYHGAEYGVALSMSSTRTYKYESINGNNETGWYHNDGMLYIYTDDYDFGFQHFWWADPYMNTGTTVNLATRKDVNIHPMIYNKYDFSGGVSHGQYGIGAFILGYPETAMQSGSNTFANEDCINIEARKSYFFFDDEIICLGSGIKDTSGESVVTVVENRMWGIRNGWMQVDDELYINGELVAEDDLITLDRSYYDESDLAGLGTSSSPNDAPSIPETSINARAMYFTGMGGYVFLRADANGVDKDGNAVKYAIATNNPYRTVGDPTLSAGDYTTAKDFLEIVIDHGENPTGGSYCYAYLPECEQGDEMEYYNNPDVVLLARDTNTHAVIETTLGIVGCVFFNQNGGEVKNDTNVTSIKRVTAKDDCTVMVTKNADGSYTVSVSDPTMLEATVELEIEISGITEVASADSGVNATVANEKATISVNTQNSNGATFEITLK